MRFDRPKEVCFITALKWDCALLCRDAENEVQRVERRGQNSHPVTANLGRYALSGVEAKQYRYLGGAQTSMGSRDHAQLPPVLRGYSYPGIPPISSSFHLPTSSIILSFLQTPSILAVSSDCLLIVLHLLQQGRRAGGAIRHQHGQYVSLKHPFARALLVSREPNRSTTL